MPEIKIVLNDLLKERDLNQSDLVDMTGIRSEAISNIVRGKIERLSLDHLQKIMTALEITDVGELLKYVSNPDVSKERPFDADAPIGILNLPAEIINMLGQKRFEGITTVRDLVLSDGFISQPEILRQINDAVSSRLPESKDLLNNGLYMLHLPRNIERALEHPDYPEIKTIRELRNADKNDLSSRPGIGDASLWRIDKCIEEYLKYMIEIEIRKISPLAISNPKSK